MAAFGPVCGKTPGDDQIVDTQKFKGDVAMKRQRATNNLPITADPGVHERWIKIGRTQLPLLHDPRAEVFNQGV